MVIVWLALLGASVVVAAVTGLVYLFSRGKPPEPRALLRWAARLWVFNVVLDLALLYFAMPALTGPLWGGQWLLWPLLLTGLLALSGGGFRELFGQLDRFTEAVNSGRMGGVGMRGFTASGMRPGMRGRRGGIVDSDPKRRAPVPNLRAASAAGAAAIIVAVVLGSLGNWLITAATTWFDPNVKALAALANVQSAPQDAPALPPTDVNHIVLVTQGVAGYLGQTAIAGTGQNLGSQYHTDRHEYTLQSVKGHLYWVAPLIYNNLWANLGNWQSPGYVAVDAEDPNASPQVRTGFHLRYLPDAVLNYDLTRHVYLSGYTGTNLVEPTLEVNDDWQPYYTITLTSPARGFSGPTISGVLLVDPQTGDITKYAPDKVPAWVDRVVPSWVASEYLGWWGKYSKAGWINPSGKDQQVPAGAMELVYNQADEPVWLQPMTSGASSDKSSTGVVLFDTRDTRGTFYPLTGLGVSDSVAQTITGSRDNIRDYGVGGLQLYQIYGEPTWVATFVRDNEYGQSFQAVALVDAKHLSGANVIIASTKSEALSAYSQWLATNHYGNAGPSQSGKEVTARGKVTRIAQATERGDSVYYLQIEGQQHIFKAGIALSPKLPLVQPGDSVTVTYRETGEDVAALLSFDDQTIQAAPSPSPAAR